MSSTYLQLANFLLHLHVVLWRRLNLVLNCLGEGFEQCLAVNAVIAQHVSSGTLCKCLQSMHCDSIAFLLGRTHPVLAQSILNAASVLCLETIRFVQLQLARVNALTNRIAFAQPLMNRFLRHAGLCLKWHQFWHFSGQTIYSHIKWMVEMKLKMRQQVA